MARKKTQKKKTSGKSRRRTSPRRRKAVKKRGLSPETRDRLSMAGAFLVSSAILLLLYFLFLHEPFEAKRKNPRPAPPSRISQSSESSVDRPTPPVKETVPATAPAPVVSGLQRTQRIDPRKPRLVFVIDDIGYHIHQEQEMRKLGSTITYAILPMLPYSRHFSKLGRQMEAEVILHQPLETVDGTIPGKGLITSRMNEDHMRDVLNRNLYSVPNHVGVNNHMGSEGTADPKVMATLLTEFKRRGLFYLDSMTTPESSGPVLAKRYGVPVLKRDIFLDNIDSKPEIRSQLAKALVIARRQGYAISIGHYRKNTLDVLYEEIPKLKREGYQIVRLSDLL